MSTNWRPSTEAILAAYNHLFHSSLSLAKIKDAAIEGRLLGTGAYVAGRSIAWKLFLLLPDEPLHAEPSFAPGPYVSLCESSRKQYQSQLLEKMRAPDGSYEEGLNIPGLGSSLPRRSPSAVNLDTNNPLSLHVENPWKEWFAAMDLRKTISQDVERTFPDVAYFRDADVQAHLTNVLYLWSTANPEIGYRQGMHELLAMIYIAVDYDSIEDSRSSGAMDLQLLELCSRTWAGADAWALFVAMMRGMGKWYEWREPSATVNPGLKSHVHLPVENGQVKLPSYVAPVVQSCNKIQSQYLKSVDPQLWRSMQAAGIEPQIFGIRWLRLLFTREFNMQDSMVMWDGLLACDPEYNLAEWICVAMLLRIRNQLIPADYTEQLTCLLRYPAILGLGLRASTSGLSDNPSEPHGADEGSMHPSSLLLRQALGLQLTPTPATGASIMIENRNMLHIPIEVPEPPPPPPRRQGRHIDRNKMPSESGPPGAGASGMGGAAGPGTIRASHLKQLSQQAQNMGLPDIAKGLQDRAESLGINKTSFFNAVSELRRNLPDLAASAASLVKSPNQQMTFPLLDERSSAVEPIPEERPPWEPRTRREMEEEIIKANALHKKLGDSVAWIVDVLLLSEESNDHPQKTPNGQQQAAERNVQIRRRKQGALESLAYIRDVLQGRVQVVEEDRLWDDEDLISRRARAQSPQGPATSALLPPNVSQMRTAVVAPTLPASSTVRSAPMMAPSTSSSSSTSASARSPNTPFMPRFSPPVPSIPPVYALPTSPSPSAPTSPGVLSPGMDAVSLAPFAPWKYTKSDFSAPLPDMPPPQPTSSTLPKIPTARTPSPTVDRVDRRGTPALVNQGTLNPNPSSKFRSPMTTTTRSPPKPTAPPPVAPKSPIESQPRQSVDGLGGTKSGKGRQEVIHDPLGALR